MDYRRLLYGLLFLVFICETIALPSSSTLIPTSQPKEIYGNAKNPIKVRLCNGGAGATGLIRALAEDYLNHRHLNYSIVWYKDVSTICIKKLKAQSIDLGLVYELKESSQAVDEGWGTLFTLIFNDRFVLVGPKNNPAKINKHDTITEAFHKIAASDKTQKLFLSRDDNSATNIRERALWTKIQLTPWATHNLWYQKFNRFPKETLQEANRSNLYTLIDFNTWQSN